MDTSAWHCFLWMLTCSLGSGRISPLKIRIMNSNLPGSDVYTNATNGRHLNTNLVVEHTKISDGSPFAVLSSIKKWAPAVEDLVILGGDLCDVSYMSSVTYLYQTPVLCYREYTPVPDFNSPETEDEATPQEPRDTCNVYGDLSTGVLVKTLPALMDAVGWKRVVIFYDQHMTITLNRMYDPLSLRGIQASAHVIEGDTTSQMIHKLLWSAYNETSGHVNFLVMCEEECFQKVISQADVFDVQNDNHTAMWKFSKWLVYYMGEQAWPNTNLRVDNVAKITLPALTARGVPGERSLFLNLNDVHKSCVESEVVWQVDNQTLTQRLIRMLQEDTCWRGEITTLLYKETGRQLSPVGEFNPHGELLINDDVFPNANFGFNMRTLKIGSNFWASWFAKTNTTDVGYEGLCIDLLLHLAESLNFTYTIVVPMDGDWGNVVNGSWTGLVLGLLERDMDMVIAPFTVTLKRQAVIDFTIPFFYDSGVGIYKLPDPNKAKWFQLIKPFKGMVLACLAISVIAVSVLLYVMEVSYLSLHGDGTATRRTILQDSTWYIFGAMLAHGGTTQPQSESGRVLVGFWWLFSIVIAASYSGTLIAFLTVSRDPPLISTMADVGDQSDYKWGTVGGSAWLTYFQSSPREDVKKLWEGMERFATEDPDVLSKTSEVHKRKVLAGSYILFAAGQDLAMWSENECSLAITTEKFQSVTYAIAVIKDSPLLEVLSTTMMQLDQSGLFLAWTRKWLPIKSTCAESRSTSSRAITIIDLQSAFYLSAIGLLVSSITLAFEIVLSRHRTTENTEALKTYSDCGECIQY